MIHCYTNTEGQRSTGGPRGHCTRSTPTATKRWPPRRAAACPPFKPSAGLFVRGQRGTNQGTRYPGDGAGGRADVKKWLLDNWLPISTALVALYAAIVASIGIVIAGMADGAQSIFPKEQVRVESI